MNAGTPEPVSNRLLSTLDSSTFHSIRSSLELIDLGLKHYVYQFNEPILYAYFPVTGMISMTVDMKGKKSVEVATIGNEGMAGIPLLLGTDTTPGNAFCQVPGKALRMPADTFREVLRSHEPFRRILHVYAQALMVQIAQGNGCNQIHSIEERCARWLLQTHDRVKTDELSLTQEFLGQMLGVRRASVNLVASTFQKAGYIRYVRGKIQVLNRAGLESAACHCYELIRREYDRLFNDAASA